ncbi:dicarboxylate/amino acid:cation symporter [Luteimonas fraxinea]|uniref:Dicarboxylate/amino acid:cation symporter n=1 Tax=Luteimonas fraxinea TaxID=2901869 RepID=A0ABS8UBZ4_9GAMM|nr:cation:dicarboxylase symporter family transporter [Luteimonas fraxinea]MCD9097018.1 dicarboxylate/amino acid:cation symporter [Luteimonas fraxinea]MCD9126645.1 dicarboxylate/amino acid:cation symporter [Luteimonas fraxinea]UHH09609.1 dicarboxylate/amino acid:cation symporter [Luteimonas fraxinea]
MTEAVPARRTLPASVRVLLALLAGAVVGLSLAAWNADTALRVAEFAQPIGKLWLNALQMTVVPLVAALVVVGINGAADAAASGRNARMAMATFAVLLAICGTFAAIAAPALLSLVPRDDALVGAFRAAIQAPEVLPQAPSFGLWITSVIPSNAIAAAAASAMLPLVVFSMFFGFALTRLEPERRERMLDLVRTIGDAMIVVVRWVLWAAPVGVFALVLAVCAHVGLGVLTALGYYIALQCVLYVAITLLMYVVAVTVAGERLPRFAAALLPVQAIAASTQSSLASLPVMIDSARNRLGYPLAVTSLVLPMAVSLFRIASPTQYLSVVVFIAWMYGADLGPAQLAIAVGLSIVISMGSVGLPGQVSFMTNNLPVTQAMGLPIEPLGVLLAVDTLPDAFATVANTTADVTATAVVARHSGTSATADLPPT